MLINLNLNGGSFDLILRTRPRPRPLAAQLRSVMMMMSSSRGPRAPSHIVTGHVTIIISEENKLMTPIIWNILKIDKLGALWNLSLVQNKLLEFNCNAWPGQSVNLLGKYWTKIFHHEVCIFNPVDIMVVNVGRVMIIKFTDLHQIKLIRTRPCRESRATNILNLPPRGFKCFEHGTFFRIMSENCTFQLMNIILQMPSLSF